VIYVDEAIWKRSPTGRKTYAHLVAPTREELDEFASTIGVKPHFFHNTKKFPHYDITAEQREVAIARGAVPIDTREIVRKFQSGELKA
jgi:Protein of unknown function (DUF4031)